MMRLHCEDHRRLRTRNAMRSVYGVLLWVTVGGPIQAQDKVVLQRDRGSRIVLNCLIVDYTGSSITVRSRPKSLPKTYPASQVIEVRTPQSEVHQQGLTLYAADRIEEANVAFNSALKQEPRSWVRREILAMSVRCSQRLGDYSSAGSRFLLLVGSDSQTRHFKIIPLIWASLNLPRDVKSDARAWLGQDENVARLLGASLLLDDVSYSQSAQDTLRQLKRNTDPRIRELAASQLWRTKLRSTDVSRMELQRWQVRIRMIPKDLRGGAFYLLGRGHLIRREHEQAAAAFLWLPLVFDSDYHLSARACLAAADALSSIRQTNEATTLYREVTYRFSDTVFAQEAAAHLKIPSSNQQSTP